MTIDQKALEKAVATAIFDPGATEGMKGERTLTEWQVAAVMRALATQPAQDQVEHLIDGLDSLERFAPKIVPMGANPPLFDGMQTDNDGPWLSRVAVAKYLREAVTALSAGVRVKLPLDELIRPIEGIERNQPGYHHRKGWNDAIMHCMDLQRALSDTPTSPAPLEGVTDEQVLASEILAELTRARTKFPGKNVTFAALVEEVGELATATFEESRDRVRKEAVQVAVMAMRMVLDGDHTFDDWRAEKGLDPLVAALSRKG